MSEIERLAALVVWRGFGFCWLAISMAMSGLIFDLSLASRIGALLAIGLAFVLQLRAVTYHRIRRIDETEVWILLDERRRPSKEAARALIVPAMQSQLREKALYSAAMAAALLAISVSLRFLAPA